MCALSATHSLLPILWQNVAIELCVYLCIDAMLFGLQNTYVNSIQYFNTNTEERVISYLAFFRLSIATD